jgi:hypothetical protein
MFVMKAVLLEVTLSLSGFAKQILELRLKFSSYPAENIPHVNY